MTHQLPSANHHHYRRHPRSRFKTLLSACSHPADVSLSKTQTPPHTHQQYSWVMEAPVAFKSEVSHFNKYTWTRAFPMLHSWELRAANWRGLSWNGTHCQHAIPCNTKACRLFHLTDNITDPCVTEASAVALQQSQFSKISKGWHHFQVQFNHSCATWTVCRPNILRYKISVFNLWLTYLQNKATMSCSVYEVYIAVNIDLSVCFRESLKENITLTLQFFYLV